MRILVRHAPPFRRWQRRLGERLEAAGHRVRYEAVGRPVGRLVLAFERRLYGVTADWDAAETPPAAETWAPDLTLELAGPPPAAGLVLQTEIAGKTGEAALLAAACAGIAPLVVVRGGAPGVLPRLAAGRPAMEDRHVCARALEDLLPCLVTLLVQAVARLESGESECPALDEDASVRRVSTAAFLARGLSHKLARRLGSARGRPDHWRLALRREGDATCGGPTDDSTRFWADPFFFEEAGRLWLFYEEYPYATAKGVIGCLAITAAPSLRAQRSHPGADAAVSRRPWVASPSARKDGHAPEAADQPRIVLEEAFHLSYPLVLRHRDAIYMLPETSAAARVQLYRADLFPDRWVPDAVLIDGRRLADATPVLHEGKWWLFATANADGGSTWDQLHLYHAPDLLGPWRPHAGNPVLIDAGAARPAGLMWHEDGVLMRPAQDCRTGYGDGVVVCKVDRLDERGYRQSVVRRIAPPPGATGLHTLNRAAGWEVVDLKVPHPR